MENSMTKFRELEEEVKDKLLQRAERAEKQVRNLGENLKIMTANKNYYKEELRRKKENKFTFADYQRVIWQMSNTDLHLTDFKRMFGDKMKSMYTIQKKNIDSVQIQMFKLQYVKPIEPINKVKESYIIEQK